MKKFISLLFGVILIFSLTGCGKSKEEKLIEYLEDIGYKCKDTLDCKKTKNDITKRVYFGRQQVEFEIETDEVTFKMGEKSYNDENYAVYVDNYPFIPEECDSQFDCTINIGDKVYPEDHKNYLKYIESDKYQEYLDLKDRYDLSLSEEYHLLSLELVDEMYDDYRKYEKYTDDVNKYMREFEDYLEEYN